MIWQSIKIIVPDCGMDCFFDIIIVCEAQEYCVIISKQCSCFSYYYWMKYLGKIMPSLQCSELILKEKKCDVHAYLKLEKVREYFLKTWKLKKPFTF